MQFHNLFLPGRLVQDLNQVSYPLNHSQDTGMGWAFHNLVDPPQTQGFQSPSLRLGPPVGASHQFDFQHSFFFLCHNLILDPRMVTVVQDLHRG